MRIATLLDLSAALVLSACASTQPKVEEKSPEISVKKIAGPMDSTAVAAPKADPIPLQFWFLQQHLKI